MQEGLPNPAIPDPDIDSLQVLLPQVVDAVQKIMRERRQAFERETRPKLDAQLLKLEILENRHFQQLDLYMQTSEQIEAIKQKRREQETEAIRSRFQEYRQWIKETMNTEEQPYIQIVAAVIH